MAKKRIIQISILLIIVFSAILFCLIWIYSRLRKKNPSVSSSNLKQHLNQECIQELRYNKISTFSEKKQKQEEELETLTTEKQKQEEELETLTTEKQKQEEKTEKLEKIKNLDILKNQTLQKLNTEKEKLNKIKNDLEKKKEELEKIKCNLENSIKLGIFYISLIKISEYKKELDIFLIKAEKTLQRTITSQKNDLNSLITDINLALIQMNFWLKKIDYPNLQNIQSFFEHKKKYAEFIIKFAFFIENEYFKSSLPDYINEIMVKYNNIPEFQNKNILIKEQKYTIEKKSPSQNKFFIKKVLDNSLVTSVRIIKQDNEEHEKSYQLQYKKKLFQLLNQHLTPNQDNEFISKKQLYEWLLPYLSTNNTNEEYILPVMEGQMLTLKFPFPLGLQFLQDQNILQSKKFLNDIYYFSFEKYSQYKDK